MSANVVPEAPAVPRASSRGPVPALGRLLWSVRRELWEHRAIALAPLATAGVLFLSFVASSVRLPEHRRAALLLDLARQRIAIERAYDIATSMILLTVFLVWLFYCLDALHGERRDRSILFWKALPVSDGTVVLSKACIPLVVLPLITFAVIVATQGLMLLESNAVLRASGIPATTSSQLPLVQSWPALLYGLAAMTLWDAPIYAWLLLVSGWARKAPLLWATVPLLLAGVLERVMFQTAHVVSFLWYRGMGWTWEAFAARPRGTLLIDPMNRPAPVHFLTTPGLWIGLALAILFLAAAVRLRRRRAPL